MSGMAPPPPPRGRHLTASDALKVIGIVVLILVVLVGRSVRHAGEEMQAGWERSLVLAFGKPAGWVADKLPVQDLWADATDPLKPGDDLDGPGGFADAGAAGAQHGVPPVTPDAFDAAALGAKPVTPPRPLKTVLVTGDSMSMPLDAEVARRLAGSGIEVVRDPHVGTGLSFSSIVDWGKLSTSQVSKDKPDATIVFIGANDGFPLKYAGKSYECCGPQWAATYATRARTVMNTFRQGGGARVYWLLLPGPRDPDRQKIARAVNLADTTAAAPYRAQVRLLDLGAIFTPGGRYRSAMPVDGQETIVRQPDGIHLNQAGASIAADQVLRLMRADYGDRIPG